MFGELIKTTTMGQEAKDLKVKDAKVFRTNAVTTGVAVLTNSNRLVKFILIVAGGKSRL